MKTRTLLLLSVGTALAILLAGGVLLVQLTRSESVSPPVPFGEVAQIGDVEVVVVDTRREGDVLRVDVRLGGLDDADGIDSFSLVVPERVLRPLPPAGVGDRCATIRIDVERCFIDFDVSSAAGSSRILLLRRGDAQATWRLA